MKKPRQLILPKFRNLPGWDHGPRAHLYQTMHLLGKREDECLALAEDEDNEEWEAADAALATITEQARSFASMVLAPVYKSWWL